MRYGPPTQTAALERFVGSLVLARPREPAVGWAVRELETPERRVRDLVAESGMSKRRFVNTFRQNVGLSPKQFQRVRRLRRALHALERGTASAEAALAAGYYDQAHLIHEFQALAGMSPSAYIRRRSGYSGHAAVD